MITQEITLLTNGRVSYPKGDSGLSFGYIKNRGIYNIKVNTTGEWNGLIIRACWHIPNSDEVTSSLLQDGIVEVPALVTSYDGNGELVFEGTDGTKTITSANVYYHVSKNSGICDDTIQEPGTPAWQELVGTVKKYSDTAVEAKESAKKSADEAKQALEDTKDVKSQAIEEINSSKTAVIEEIENKKNLSIEEINSVKEDAKGELETLCDSTRDFANQAKEAADRAKESETKSQEYSNLSQSNANASSESASNAKASEDASKKNADDSAATLQELKDGIASGDFKGDKGDPGPAGQDGKDAPQIDDTTVTDSAPWSSKHIVDMLCPPISETGNPVVCYPVAGYPLGCKVSWEPTQEGTGDPSPENVRPISGRDSVSVERCGENLVDSHRVVDVSAPYGLTVQYVSGKITISGIYSNPSATASFSFMSLSYKLPATTKLMHLGLTTSGCKFEGIRFTNNEERDRIAIDISRCTNGEKIEISFYLIAYVGTATPTTYAPYTGQTTTLTLPHTIYGGTVDAVTGEGLGMWKLLTLDGTTNKFSGGATYWNLPQNSAIGIGDWYLNNIYSSHFSNVFGGNAMWNFIYTTTAIMTKYFPDADALNAYLAAQYAAGTPVQIAYRLVEPVPFTATGAQPIPALSGVNTVLTDADSVTVTGRADPIKRIIDLEDAVASMT